jgi:hypothetical protein
LGITTLAKFFGRIDKIMVPIKLSGCSCELQTSKKEIVTVGGSREQQPVLKTDVCCAIVQKCELEIIYIVKKVIFSFAKE